MEADKSDKDIILILRWKEREKGIVCEKKESEMYRYYVGERE